MIKKILSISIAVIVFIVFGTFLLRLNQTKGGALAYTAPNPDVPGTDIHYVDDWTTFNAAWTNNTTCSKIVLLNNINGPGATEAAGAGVSTFPAARTMSIEIDGRDPANGTVYRLHMGDAQLRTSGTTPSYASGGGLLHVHDIELRQNITTANSPLETNYYLFRVGTSVAQTDSNGNWVFRFGNITVNRRNIANVNRGGAHHLAYTYGSGLEFYGYNVLELSEETAHPSSVEVEDNTVLLCRKMSTSDTSMFYFYYGFDLGSNTIAKQRGSGFRIGNNCTVVTYNDKGGTTYPSIYYRYSFLEVGENSVFAATMTGNAFRAQFSQTTHFTVGAGSIINLTSLNNGQPAFELDGISGFTFESQPGSEIYIVGDNASAVAASRDVVNMRGGTSGSPNQFIVNSPKYFDIRNKRQENTNVFHVGGANDIVRFNDTDIDMWYTRTYATNPNYAPHNSQANLYVMDAGYYQITGISTTATQITTSEPDLSSMWRSRYTRISGGKDRCPEILFDMDDDALVKNPEDADKFVRVRAVLAWTPNDDGVDEDGNVMMIPIYAPPNQVKVWISSDDGSVETSEYSSLPGSVLFNDPEDGADKWFLAIDANGYLLIPPGYPGVKLDGFLEADILLSAKALRHNSNFSKTRLGEEFSARIKDVTPPKPAQITGVLLQGQSVISGYNGEFGATVSVSINGAPELSSTACVEADGTWSLALPGMMTLNAGEQVRIFMTDEYGNKNPISSAPYHDAVFPPASVFIVQELPALLHLRQIVRNGEDERFVPDVGYVTVLKCSGSNLMESVNAVVSSGHSESATDYTSFTYSPMALDILRLKTVVPQYYRYAGCDIYLAEEDSFPAYSFNGTQVPEMPVSAVNEYWINIYIEPVTNTTTYYKEDTATNEFGTVRRPITPAMSLTADSDIGQIGNNNTVRVTSKNTPYTITVTSDVWGDGIHSDNVNWSITASGLTGAGWNVPASQLNSSVYTFTIPTGSNVSGMIKVTAQSVDNPSLTMVFTVKVINLIIINTDSDMEMTQNYILRVRSFLSPIELNFTASKSVNWSVTSPVRLRSGLQNTVGETNKLTIPANFTGTIYVSADIRNYRIIVYR